jgi:hypothetical protein
MRRAMTGNSILWFIGLAVVIVVILKLIGLI